MYKYVVLSKVNQNAIQKIKINEVSIFIYQVSKTPKMFRNIPYRDRAANEIISIRMCT